MLASTRIYCNFPCGQKITYKITGCGYEEIYLCNPSIPSMAINKYDCKYLGHKAPMATSSAIDMREEVLESDFVFADIAETLPVRI